MTDAPAKSDEDTAKLREQANRGAEAARILSSPLVKEFFAKMKDHVRKEWENSAAGDDKAREHQWRVHQSVVLLEECFTSTIGTGKFADKKLKAAANAEKPGVVSRALSRIV